MKLFTEIAGDSL